MEKIIYMDNHATTPVAPEVLSAMLPYLNMHFGNAASTHPLGVIAKDAVDIARQQVAELLGCSSDEILFTSGATESNNLAIRGIAYAYRARGNHIITSRAEHHAVLDTCHALTADGFDTTYLPVDNWGMVAPDDVEAAITRDTVLMSFMYANNEVGTINPLSDIAAIAAKHDVIFHSDAVQAVGKLPSNVTVLGLDLASITAHKIYGPKGIGALYVRSGTELHPLFYGGGQETGKRPGTLNVPGIVGLGAACQLAKTDIGLEKNHVIALRDGLHDELALRLPDIHLNGNPVKRLPGNLNLCFAGVQSHALLMGLKRVAVSTGSACDSASVTPSHVLTAMGVPAELAMTAVRFGLGRYNTWEEVGVVVDEVVPLVKRLRALSSD